MLVLDILTADHLPTPELTELITGLVVAIIAAIIRAIELSRMKRKQ
jgi:hypothetical protein